MYEEIAKTLTGVQDRLNSLDTRLTELAEEGKENRSVGLFGSQGPRVRTGESSLTSRGFQYSRLIGLMNHRLDKDQAKVELDLCSRLQNEYVARGHFSKEHANSVVVPLCSDLMAQTDSGMEKLARETGEVVRAGVSGFDRQELASALQKTKALSWQDATALAELVPFPQLGEPIELLRNQEVFMKAGARVIPFPQSGRAVWPRFTGATSAYWVGTSTQDRSITESEPTTGDVVLQAKKLAVRVTIPNELFRFPTVSVEQYVRMDMARSASLKMDKAFFDAVGSNFEPRGLLHYDNVLSYTGAGVGTNGNTLEPEDILKMIATVEERNIEFKNWVVRPLMYAALGNRRADATAPGDRKGPFLFSMLRDGQAGSRDVSNYSVGSLEGYPAYKSNQIGNLVTKGSGTGLTTLWGGNFGEYMIALGGVMEFAMATQGEIFAQDQSQIRLITWVDGAPRHEEAFIAYKELIVG